MSGATTRIFASLIPVTSEITVRRLWGCCEDAYTTRRPVATAYSAQAPWPSSGRPVMRCCSKRSSSTLSALAKAPSTSPVEYAAERNSFDSHSS